MGVSPGQDSCKNRVRRWDANIFTEYIPTVNNYSDVGTQWVFNKRVFIRGRLSLSGILGHFRAREEREAFKPENCFQMLLRGMCKNTSPAVQSVIHIYGGFALSKREARCRVKG